MIKQLKCFTYFLLRNYGYDVVPYREPHVPKAVNVRPEFQGLQFSAAAIRKLLDDYPFDKVLDVGCGAGAQSEIFLRHGKQVTAVDYGRSVYFDKNPGTVRAVIGDFVDLDFEAQFDCVWASHVLEHQLNVNRFLKKVNSVTREGGVVCITVPPLDHMIRGGHVSLWNGGLLLYNMVLAGFDCRDTCISTYGYNISLIVRKKTATMPEPRLR